MDSTHERDEHSIGRLLAPDILALLEESPGDVAVDTEELHPADLADVAEALDRAHAIALLVALPPGRAADVLSHVEETLRSDLLEEMGTERAAELIKAMTPDDRADAIESLEDDVADPILAAIPREERAETERLLQYEPDTAGGLMTTDFVAVPEDATVEQALGYVREAARLPRKEAMYAIYATDPAGRLHGVLSLRELLAAADGSRVSDVAWTEVVSVRPEADRAEVAQLVSNYDLVVVPVVSEDHKILGAITVDDVIDAIQAEQTEDVQKLGGLEALDEPYMKIGFTSMLRKRAGWLCALFLGEMLTATAMGHFEHEIERAVVLALFVPLIISSGGNSGSQATSLIIRAMALQEVRLRDWWRVAARELPTGLCLGALLGAIGVIRVFSWQALGLYDYGPHAALVAFTVGIALIGVVTFGSLAGAMLPFVLRRAGFDPASASAPFVATLVDVTGLIIYFLVALVMLRGTLL